MAQESHAKSSPLESVTLAENLELIEKAEAAEMYSRAFSRAAAHPAGYLQSALNFIRGKKSEFKPVEFVQNVEINGKPATLSLMYNKIRLSKNTAYIVQGNGLINDLTSNSYSRLNYPFTNPQDRDTAARRLAFEHLLDLLRLEYFSDELLEHSQNFDGKHPMDPSQFKTLWMHAYERGRLSDEDAKSMMPYEMKRKETSDYANPIVDELQVINVGNDLEKSVNLLTTENVNDKKAKTTALEHARKNKIPVRGIGEDYAYDENRKLHNLIYRVDKALAAVQVQHVSELLSKKAKPFTIIIAPSSAIKSIAAAAKSGNYRPHLIEVS